MLVEARREKNLLHLGCKPQCLHLIYFKNWVHFITIKYMNFKKLCLESRSNIKTYEITNTVVCIQNANNFFCRKCSVALRFLESHGTGENRGSNHSSLLLMTFCCCVFLFRC
jgi:hypothetical protein